MYDSLACNCKVLINIKGGGHCYFADANFICSLGEFGCPPFTITREQQHATTLDFTKLYLDFYLKNVPAAWTAFNDSLNTSPRITFQKSCTTTSVYPAKEDYPFNIFPNPAENYASIRGNTPGNLPVLLKVKDVYGRMMFDRTIVPAGTQFCLTLDMQSWTSGIYFAEFKDSHESRVVKILKR